MRRQSLSQGFTMIELLVAVAIMAVVTASVLSVFATQHKTYVGQERVLEVQQDARLVAEMVLADVRAAGLLMPPFTAIAGRDGGTSGPDVLCVSDPSVLNETEILAALAPFDGANLFALVDDDDTTVELVASTMDVDADGDDDFAVNAGIILSDGGDTHCARVTDVTGNVVTFVPATPAGFLVGTASGRAAPAVIYELTGPGFLRNTILLSAQVENVQVEYAIDADDDGAIGNTEFPIHDMTASDPSLIRGLRLSVITRTPSEDPEFRGSGMPAAGNHDPGSADGFVRRRFTANVAARNLL
jgi:prepilin-type N-terminal cleavage/methylation domain-containing protein